MKASTGFPVDRGGMIVGARIKERLKHVKMSQSELARRVGLDQSTISGLVNGDQQSTTKLPQIARELQTTTAYLSAETDDPQGEASATPSLSSDARELLDLYQSLPVPDQAALLRVARSMNGITSPPPAVHEKKSAYRPKEKA